MMMLTESIRQNAQLHPEKSAIVFENRRLTWEQFHQRSNRVANRLTKLRIDKGDRVAIVSPNCLEYPEIMFGALKAGSVILPLSTELAPEDVVTALLAADAKALFAGHSVLSLVSGFRKLCTKIVVEGREEGWLTYEGFLKAGVDSEPAHILSAEDPYGKECTHGERLAFAESCTRELGIDEGSISFVGTPLSEEGTQRLYLPTVLAGGTLELTRSFDPVDFAELVRRERCTHAVLPPGADAVNSANFTKNEITFVEFV